MHSPDPHSHRQKVREGTASNVCNTTRWTEEDYFRGLAADVDRAYVEWVAMRKSQGDLTIEMPKANPFHQAAYVKGQGPQKQGDATDKAHLEDREEDDAD